MSDLIDRQDAIKAFDGEKYDNPFCGEYEVGYNDGIDFAVSKISTLPPAQPEQRWIPVTERLPEKHSSAIVTDFCHVTIAYTNNLGEWMDYDGNKLKNVTAWMPLPEPYREEAEDEQS